MKNAKRILAALLVMIMVLSAMSVTAFATEGEGINDEKLIAIIEGANEEWKDTNEDRLYFTTDADFDTFKSVKVDGKAIDAKHYVVKENGTIIALKVDYLKSLDDGKHTIAIAYEDEDAVTDFTVTHIIKKVEAKEAKCDAKGNKEHYACACGHMFEDAEGEKEITDKSKVEIKALDHTKAKKITKDHKQHWYLCTVCDEVIDKKEDHKFDKTGSICEVCGYDVNDPKTGDEFNFGLMAVLMMASFVGLASSGTYVYNKKRK